MSKKNEKKNTESKAPKNNEPKGAKKQEKKAETPKVETPKAEDPKAVAEAPKKEAPKAEEPTEQSQLPGVEKPKGKNPLDPKPEKAPKEKKAPKEFTLKSEMESMLIDGKTPGQIIEALTPMVAKACNKDEKWANARIKQELGFFKNYCGPYTVKLDLMDALNSELEEIVFITGINAENTVRIKEIVAEIKTLVGAPAAAEAPTK